MTQSNKQKPKAHESHSKLTYEENQISDIWLHSLPREVFRDFFEKFEYGILLLDNGKILDCNTAFMDLLGYRCKKSLIQSCISDLSPPHQSDNSSSESKMTELFSCDMRQDSNQFKWLLSNSDGQHILANVTPIPVTKEGKSLLLTVWRNGERESGANEEYFQTTMASCPISMELYTPDGILRNYNHAFEKMYNLDASSLVHKHNVFEDEKVKEIGALPYLLRTRDGESFNNHIYEYDSSVGFDIENGRKCWLKSCFFPIKDNNGKVQHFIIMHEDITELKQHQNDLESLVEKRTAELHEANILLQKEIEARKQAQEDLEKVNQELQHLATTDGLTQVANRRTFDNYIDLEWKRCSLVRLPLAVILCDIDCFKGYNDTYGHQAGDDCLQQVAKAMQSAIKRPDDLFARYGGEEFIVVLPNTDADGAMKIAKDIQKAVNNLTIENKASTVHKYVSVSIGVSSLVPDLQHSSDTIITISDQALYSAKEKGRNQIVLTDESFSRKV